MKRRDLLTLAALGPLGWMMHTLAADTPAKTGIRTIKGTVMLNGKPAQPGMPVVLGDVIETGPDSQVIYVVDSDAFLQRANSRVELGGNPLKRILRLTTGALLGVFGKGDTTLHTSTATIGIRGTACYMECEPARSYVCLCYGEAELTPDAAPEMAMRYHTQHHEKPYWILKDGAVMVPTTAINHSDAELELLESLVGRVPAFVRDNSKFGRRY
ncbi:hypothetical protein IGB42_01152 [Andreprevotia sp. IGB-42]|uniref:hypothetical protein n=1 Tax=Andreprevotia sp. IGB-42 TaxID=2497473 RepID=UPI0013595A06|nr:hypothetical protein [Andreprevotia sp. IGB-42]KAF0814253.1 hypothetical protein IGB42_01152 [Andreprevotia sp. IGB-42]